MSTIGILGGGQLGQMLVSSGSRLGMKFKVYSPTKIPYEAEWIKGDYQDGSAMKRFAAMVDLLTFEFENLPIPVLETLESFAEIYPRPKALRHSQDRLLEKDFLNSLGISTAPYLRVDTFKDLQEGMRHWGVPAILKTRRDGYDGKGQYRLEPDQNFEEVKGVIKPDGYILEQRIDFDREVSLISVRSRQGETCFYPLVENVHRHGILRHSIGPANHTSVDLQQQAASKAEAILNALDYNGVLVIEFFQHGEELLVNEMACRVHNSGHWTIDGAQTSQFENHLRAITGMPLGGTQAKHPTLMVNIIGVHPDLDAIKQKPNIHVLDYQKEARNGRKLGHLNVVCCDYDEVQEYLRKFEYLLKTR